MIQVSLSTIKCTYEDHRRSIVQRYDNWMMSLKSQYSFAYGGTSVTIRFEAFRRNQTLEIRWSCQNPFERSQAGMGMDRSVHKATIEKKTVKLRADTHVTGRELRKFSIKRFQTLLPTDHSCTEQAALCVCVCVWKSRVRRAAWAPLALKGHHAALSAETSCKHRGNFGSFASL